MAQFELSMEGLRVKQRGTGFLGLPCFSPYQGQGRQEEIILQDDPKRASSYEDGSIPPLKLGYSPAHLGGSNEIMDVKIKHFPDLGTRKRDENKRGTEILAKQFV